MNNSEKYNNREKLVIYLISSLIGLVITFLVMAIMSILMVVFEISLNLLPIASSLCLAAGSFFSGLLSAKKVSSGGIVCGFVTGIIIFLIVFIISLILDPTKISFNTIIHLVITILSSMIGGILGVNQKKSIV